MKNITISLTDAHAAAIEGEIASGDFASTSEVVRAAVREFLRDRRPAHPREVEMIAELDAMDREIAAGQELLDADVVRKAIRDVLRE